MIYNKEKKKEKNQLVEVIKTKYNCRDILLFFISFLFISVLIDNEVYKSGCFKNLGPKIDIFLSYFLFFVSFFCFFNGLYPFVKSSLKKMKDITWPSLKDVFINILCVICFTGILIVFVFGFNYLFDKIIELKNIKK